MSAHKLTVFLSYVSEDQKFADAIAIRIANSFKRAVELKYMSQFALGANFRSLIDQVLDSADILLVIATGHEKLSHSFTGYEVGYFRKSQKTRRYIDEERGIDRLVIPVAMLADIPATLTDIEGIGIAETDRFLVHPEIAGKTGTNKQDPFFELLVRIDRILDQLDPIEKTPGQQLQDYSDYRDEARLFYVDLVKVMSSLPLRREMPKTKLTLRLPADIGSNDIELERGLPCCATVRPPASWKGSLLSNGYSGRNFRPRLDRRISRRHLIELYGIDAGSIEKVLDMVKTWSDQKAELYKSVESVLLEPDPSEATFELFLGRANIAKCKHI